MTLKEFKLIINSFSEELDNMVVSVVDDQQGGYGGLRTTKVEKVHTGIDWNGNQILIFKETKNKY